MTDIQLIAMISDESSHDAFTVLYGRYKQRIYLYLLKHVKSTHVAEDILTDIFMKLWTGREIATQISDFAAFIHKIAFYRAMDFLRTTARHKRLQEVYANYFMNITSDKNPETLLISAEEKKLLLHAILQLPARQKEVYLLSREEGLSHEQIAKRLHLSQNTVNNHLVAAIKNLTQILSQYQKTSLNLLMFLFF